MDEMVFVGPMERADAVRRVQGVASVTEVWSQPGLGNGLVVYLSGSPDEVAAAYRGLEATPGLTVVQRYASTR